MTTVPGGVIPVSGAGVFNIPYPANASGSARWTQVKIENATAYGLTVYFDGSPVHSLPAGVADVFSLTRGPYGPDSPPSAALTPVAPQLQVATVSEPEWGDTPGTIRPSFAEYGDTFPGAYPLALPSQAGPLAVATVPYGQYMANADVGGNQVLFGAPAAGNFWEVAFMTLAALAPASAQGRLVIRGLATNIMFLVLPLLAGAVGTTNSGGAKFTLNEGMIFFNILTGLTGGNGIGTVVARQVPITFAPT
jgi:hypothetical protein